MSLIEVYLDKDHPSEGVGSDIAEGWEKPSSKEASLDDQQNGDAKEYVPKRTTSRF